MHEVTDIFAGLDNTDPEFREEWARRLGRTLRQVSSLEITGESFEGAAVLYKGRLALHYVFEGLSVLPETDDATGPLHDLQVVIENAWRGARGPLKWSDPEARKARGKAGNPMSTPRLHRAMCAAFSVELLVRATPGLKRTHAYRRVAEIFGKAGIRGTRGGRLSHQTVEGWHGRSLTTGSLEHAAVEKELKDLLPISLDEALVEVKEWAKIAKSD